MDLEKIKQLIELIQKSGISEIEVTEGQESIRITREFKPQSVAYSLPAMPTATPPSHPLSAPPPPVDALQEKAAVPEKYTLKAPMVGTVYLAPTPGAKAFIQVGQNIKVGDVVCLIEAMKMFNQIEADRAGVITAILVDNGTPVEFHQPIITIE